MTGEVGFGQKCIEYRHRYSGLKSTILIFWLISTWKAVVVLRYVKSLFVDEMAAEAWLFIVPSIILHQDTR